MTLNPAGLPPLTRASDLTSQLGLSPADAAAAIEAAGQFPLRIPAAWLPQMRKNPDDPLLRQVLPTAFETIHDSSEHSDPVGDLAAYQQNGIIQKYQGRALLIVTGACALHCRFCFRREYPYADAHSSSSKLSGAISALADDPSIEEVILSGGDPLSLSDARLADLLKKLDRIPHILRIRIHSRHPVALPSRITTALTDTFSRYKKKLIFVTHINHADEIGDEAAIALGALADCSIPLLNQSVLLRGVNDSVTSLSALSQRLIEFRILPYYLHLLDRVRGTSHFLVDDREAVALMARLRSELPGYLIPRLVREEAGQSSKTVIA